MRGIRDLFTWYTNNGLLATSDPEMLRQVKSLNVTTLILTGLGFLFGLWNLFFYAIWLGGILLLITASGWAATITLWEPRFRIPRAHIIIGLLLSALVIGNWYGGGLIGYNTASFFLVLVIAFFIIGRWGVVWAIATIIVMGFMQILHISGYVFPNYLGSDIQSYDNIITLILSLIAVTLALYRYEVFREEVVQKLRAEKERALQASEAKSQFIRNISHELRTPLNGIIGMTELALENNDDQTQREFLAMSRKSAGILQVLIDDILDFSNLDAGALQLESTVFSLPDLVHKSLADIKQKAQQKQLEFSVDVAPQVPVRLLGDPRRVGQVLVTLVGNAVKFTERGRVEVLVDVWDSKQPETTVRFVVQDTGIGIPQERQAIIFEPFTQADGSVTRRHGGAGLGLAIAARLVDKMEGRIWVSSTVGKGSAFTLLLKFGLPVKQPAEQNHTTHNTAPTKTQQPKQGLRVLVAEDNEINERLTSTLLKKNGHEVVVARNGTDALAALERGDIDVALMDIQMPDMDGFDVTRSIRSREAARGGHVRIVAMTAYAMKDDRERCLNAGMDDYLSKPFCAEDLLKLL